MKEFTVRAEGSFKFVSSLAADTSEIFTAFKDYYETGYICIDSKHNSFILDTEVVSKYLLYGTFKIVSEVSEANN